LTDYPYTQARYIYGKRKGSLALMLHMAEGFNTVSYLANDPARGVSANFVCELDGTMVRMMAFDAASGSLNPRDRSTDKAYYGHSHLVDVLGEWWTNPNNALIQVEMEGFAATGPNAKQIEAAVTLTADAIHRFPSIRGALGHADQTNTKACPGRTDAMKRLFTNIGGHGLWEEPDLPGLVIVNVEPFSGTATIKGSGHGAIQVADKEVIFLPDGTTKPVVFKGRLAEPWPDHPDTTVYGIGDELAVFLAGDVVVTATPPVNCDDKVAAELERAAVRAHDAVLAR